jgi:L-aspartate oxidase
MDRSDFDVVIVGSGVAGLYTALNLDPALTCAIINKNGPEDSNSMYAQGGIAAVLGPDDDAETHINDTLTAGAGLCDQAAVTVLVREGPAEIERLLGLGTPFDRDDRGKLRLTREGAHTHNRIVHSGGDATGYHVTRSLLGIIRERPNITLLNHYTLVDVVTDQAGRTAGIITADQRDRTAFFAAPHVLLASGGIGHVYRNSTNARCATGDGIAAARRAGAKVRDMEFVQFHPTALVHPDQTGRFFLISEALRGEGAVLRNRRSEAFMQTVHPMADLAPRDVISRAIIAEMRKYDVPNVYLDITAKPRDFLKNRFPTIYETCMRRDLDIAINWIPVVPVQHYFMGGIATDMDGCTDLAGLYAGGETACTGVHGANRLASNSLLECLVVGRRCAEMISGAALERSGADLVAPEPIRGEPVQDIDSYRTRIRNAMTHQGGIIRERQGMSEAIELLSGFADSLAKANLRTVREFETMNMATVGLDILSAALARTHSVGAHCRSDEA